MSTPPEEMYKRMVLTIPDLVLPQDIPNIINWFDYYGIADVKDVDVREHPEEEYYVEDRPFYGYAVIEINKWYKNNASLSFYENLIAGYAKMVYDDPYYWEVDFYEPRTQKEVNAVVENQVQKLEEKFDEVTDDEDEDDPMDEDYEFEETDEEKDLKYEYLAPKNHKMKTRSKTKCKEDKSKVTSQAVNRENITLQELIVKKNKNYAKRNKRKSFKNEWSRRLRLKLEA
tara:strand:+ start:353 stop:1039 length:687 start_codon:yes stop_codon:yes gene_type:complete